jgi:hypothetical protein
MAYIIVRGFNVVSGKNYGLIDYHCVVVVVHNSFRKIILLPSSILKIIITKKATNRKYMIQYSVLFVVCLVQK